MRKITNTTVTPEMRLPTKLPSLTSLRAFAALFVFVFHLNSAGIITFAPAKLGYSGVAFFFVLSGFLLAWADRRGSSSPQFYLRRFARIYPAHLLMLVVVLCLPDGDGARGPLPTLLHLLLIQAWVPDFAYTYSLNGVAWSLSCELAFYLLFPLLILVTRGRSIGTLAFISFGLFAGASIFVLLTSAKGAAPDLQAVAYTNPLVRLPEFVLGVCAALALRSGWRPRISTGLVIVAVAGAGMILMNDKPAADVWGTLVFLVLIVSVARLDCTRPIRVLHSSALLYAGELSFAFYLVHQVVIVHLGRTLGQGVMVGVLALAASIACAAVLHHVVERPVNDAIMARFGASRRSLAPPLLHS